MTLTSYVEEIARAYRDKLQVSYSHPLLYLVIVDNAFTDLTEVQRQNRFSKETGLTYVQQASEPISSAVSLILATEAERKEKLSFLDDINDRHWLPLFSPHVAERTKPMDRAKPLGIHFYGYKGGQARSTVLAMLAKQLADDGYAVLVVDADIEAPSLDVLLDSAASTLSQTLMGLVLSSSLIEPLSAYNVVASRGRVDMLACRPKSTDFDMDFAAFTLRTTFDSRSLAAGVEKLRAELESGNLRYDIVLFDHRSGLTSSVLPIIGAYPGPIVFCIRIDEQSRSAMPIVKVLLSQAKDLPGAYVSFSLDPEETRDRMIGAHNQRISELLDCLGDAIERDSTDYSGSDLDLPPEDFLRYWVSWFHDRAFLSTSNPSIGDLSESNRRSLLQLREVFGINGKREQAPERTSPRNPNRKLQLSPSGASDEGTFIETQEIARLFQPNTPITYVFGRKGTGKTRLLRELQSRGLGEPLTVAADACGGGLSTSDTLFTDLASSFHEDPEKLWWCLLGAALESESTSTPDFRKAVQKWENRRQNSGGAIKTSDIAATAKRLSHKRVFLIDGIETAFKSSDLIEFVEALFKFLLTIQSDASFGERVVIRLFLRTDLARRAIQNVEQQTAGRRLDLTWNTQSIFNFVLYRLTQIDWFRTSFASTCRKISLESEKLRSGLMPAEEFEPLLLEVFPKHIRRNNLQTLTFLKTYFSDAAGDDDSRAAFYPRLFDAFLHSIANPQGLPHGSIPAQPIEDDRVHQSLILSAHEAASRKFLDEVKQELTVLLNLAKKSSDNEKRVGELLNAFDGLPTPFNLEECLKKLKGKLHRIEVSNVREALYRMKEVGMFEDRPGYSNWWRAGRLFKSALRMKYVR